MMKKCIIFIVRMMLLGTGVATTTLAATIGGGHRIMI